MIRQIFSRKIGRTPDGRVRGEFERVVRLGRGEGRLWRALTLAARGELDGFGCVGAQWPIAFLVAPGAW
jgi:hypothetical protein